MALIAGPTASGKSALALALARALIAAGRSAVIVNADASQVYADLPILSARPTAAEMGDIPHRLFGHVDADVAYNAARWSVEARAALAETVAAGAVPILVGGTGMYLRLLLDGIAPVPAIPDDVRDAVRALPQGEAHAALQRLDPAAAARLAPADRTRVTRALEVVRATGRPLAAWQARREGGIADDIRLVPLILLPPREWLRVRCDQRLDAMIAAGALDEVRALMARDLPEDRPALRAIGVPELAAHISGALPLDAALERAKAATRQYAKRQYTWLRHQFPTDWPREERQLNSTVIDELAILLRQRLLTD